MYLCFYINNTAKGNTSLMLNKLLLLLLYIYKINILAYPCLFYFDITVLFFHRTLMFNALNCNNYEFKHINNNNNMYLKSSIQTSSIDYKIIHI